MILRWPPNLASSLTPIFSLSPTFRPSKSSWPSLQHTARIQPLLIPSSTPRWPSHFVPHWDCCHGLLTALPPSTLDAVFCSPLPTRSRPSSTPSPPLASITFRAKAKDKPSPWAPAAFLSSPSSRAPGHMHGAHSCFSCYQALPQMSLWLFSSLPFGSSLCSLPSLACPGHTAAPLPAPSWSPPLLKTFP